MISDLGRGEVIPRDCHVRVVVVGLAALECLKHDSSNAAKVTDSRQPCTLEFDADWIKFLRSRLSNVSDVCLRHLFF